MAELTPTTYPVTRADLVAYAEASGDHNPIHQDDEVARSVGLPGVIAHGMYTLALAARYVDEWVGQPGRIAELGRSSPSPSSCPRAAPRSRSRAPGATTARSRSVSPATGDRPRHPVAILRG